MSAQTMANTFPTTRNPARPIYLNISSLHKYPESPSVPPSPCWSDGYESCGSRSGRLPSTHDLAEFLRSSKPEDFHRPATPAALDDMSIFNGSPRRAGFRFLKQTSIKSSPGKPKEKVGSVANSVRVEKTVTGKPYLAIQVDYTTLPTREETIFNPLATPLTEDSGKRDSMITSSGFSSDCYPSRSSTTSASWKEFPLNPRNLMGGENIQYPPLWDVVSWESRSSEQDALIFCPRCQVHHKASLRSCCSTPSVNGFIGKGVPIPRNYSTEKRKPESMRCLSIASSAASGPSSPGLSYSTMPRLPRVPSNGAKKRLSPSSSQRSSTLCESEESGLENDERKVEVTSNKSPRPGPPPSRGLPSLPEAHDDALNLAQKIRKVSSTISLEVVQSHLKGKPILKKSLPEVGARKERAALVKARKMKDVSNIKQQRIKSRETTISSLDVNSSDQFKEEKREPRSDASKRLSDSVVNLEPAETRKKHPSCVLSPVMTVYTQRPMEHKRADSEDMSPPSTASTTQTYSSIPHTPLSPSPPSKSSYADAIEAQISKNLELETRIINMERRNMLLEQALLAVLRGPVYTEITSSEQSTSPSILEEFLVKSRNRLSLQSSRLSGGITSFGATKSSNVTTATA